MSSTELEKTMRNASHKFEDNPNWRNASSETNRRDLVLWGDSHAMHYFPLVATIMAEERHISPGDACRCKTRN